MKLTENFTLKELTKSDTAIRKGISNEPNTDEIEKLKLLCETILQPVRDKFGPVTVTSGYRSPELCQAIGSSVNSQHTKAEAVDFEVEGVDNADVAYWIKDNIPNWDQMILEFYTPGQPNSGWIHCSITSKLERKQFLSAYKEDGKTKYKPILGDIRCG
ncbi:Peptidase_M15_3 domain-containing protein [Pelagibacter phage Greip EXVC021P]|jgi:zinc D-Ala-D-Ala carboxypeptidase|nr:Peptidase_M15_3 domain-containing protein [Pelagibacter phage Greip EXVC021P]